MYLLKEAKARWDDFWFQTNENYLFGMGIFRIIFGAALFFYYLSRQEDIAFLYSDLGIMPRSFLNTLDIVPYRWSILDFVNDLNILNGLHVLLLVFCAAITVGLFTRVAAIGAYFLALSFYYRNPVAVFGVDTISIIYFFYLIFSRAGEKYSIDSILFKSLLAKSSGFVYEWKRTIGFLAYRLMQIELCIIYTYSGLHKLRGYSWWDGSAFWKVMTMSNFQRWDLSIVTHAPFILAIMAYSVILWEIYFSVLICSRKIRYYVLFYGAMMHVGIIVFMNLPTFGLMMMGIYFLFIDGDDIQLWVRKFLSLFRFLSYKKA